MATECRKTYVHTYMHIDTWKYPFQGKTLKGQLLNDCWSLKLASNQSTALEYQAVYVWASCDPSSALTLKPQARYGHQSVFFHASLYVVGGFAQDGLRVAAKQDIWILDLGTNSPLWQELMPTTKTPFPRGFHAMWKSGYSIIFNRFHLPV